MAEFDYRLHNNCAIYWLGKVGDKKVFFIVLKLFRVVKVFLWLNTNWARCIDPDVECVQYKQSRQKLILLFFASFSTFCISRK